MNIEYPIPTKRQCVVSRPVVVVSVSRGAHSGLVLRTVLRMVVMLVVRMVVMLVMLVRTILRGLMHRPGVLRHLQCQAHGEGEGRGGGGGCWGEAGHGGRLEVTCWLK